jgi:CheY-like chemotaxis protein
VFENARAVIGPRAEEKGLTFSVQGADRLPPMLQGDPTRLSQILLNLAGNAVKFTDSGSVTIDVSAAPREDGTLTLTCRVSDTGIGMNREQVSNLFQSFTQADLTVTRKYGGTGLGLAISKQLVELMGGTIGVDSTPGEGSCFYFSAPFLRADAAGALPGSATAQKAADTPAAPAPDRSPAEAMAVPDRPEAFLQGVRILLVEDNKINQTLVTRVLEPTEAVLAVASSGEEAVRMMASSCPDIILMDLHMPGMDGLETTRAIRALETGKTVPVIAMTASADSDTRRTCADAGMNDYVPKPFKQQTLLETLARWRPAPLAGQSRAS